MYREWSKKIYCFTVAGSHHTKWKAGAGGEKDRVIEDGGRSKDPAGQDGGITTGGTVVLWFSEHSILFIVIHVLVTHFYTHLTLSGFQELANAKGNILENKELLDSLNKTKASSITISDSLTESVRLQASLDQVCKEWHSILFPLYS